MNEPSICQHWLVCLLLASPLGFAASDPSAVLASYLETAIEKAGELDAQEAAAQRVEAADEEDEEKGTSQSRGRPARKKRAKGQSSQPSGVEEIDDSSLNQALQGIVDAVPARDNGEFAVGLRKAFSAYVEGHQDRIPQLMLLTVRFLQYDFGISMLGQRSPDQLLRLFLIPRALADALLQVPAEHLQGTGSVYQQFLRALPATLNSLPRRRAELPGLTSKGWAQWAQVRPSLSRAKHGANNLVLGEALPVLRGLLQAMAGAQAGDVPTKTTGKRRRGEAS